MQTKKINDKTNVIGKNVKKYREANHYSQEQVCQKLELLGLTLYHSDIYLIENNKRLVRDFEAYAFARVFNITLDELYSEAGKEFP